MHVAPARLLTSLAASMMVLSSAFAQEPDRQLVQNAAPPAVANGKRIALVIGNGAYTSAPPLKNPPNDARDMAATLRTLGFDVTSGINVSQKDMKRLIREFGIKLKNGGSGLFYYAGHGVQSKGRNYLIPVDANIQSEAEVEDSGVDAALVLNFMDDAQNGLNIVILDACRNNPFARSFRSANDGLAQVDAPTGTLIAYATAPGRVASDGTSQNGLYTGELLKQMQTPGVSITDMFMRVRAEVMKQTGNKQVPWEASSLVGSFYFAGASTDSSPVTTAKIDPIAFELSYWETIKNSPNADDFKAYLQRYPKGQFVELAKNRIAILSTPAKPADISPLTGGGGATELAFWDSIKNSTSADDYRAYLEKYPNGEFAGLARRRLAPLETKEKEKANAEAAAIDLLTGTKWSGDSSGGDKHYEFQFLPNSQVVWSLKWSRLDNPTYRGTYTRTGNDIHMMFPEGKPFFGGNVEATLSGNTLAGSWNFGRSEVRPDNGMYKFTVTRASSPSSSNPPNGPGSESSSESIAIDPAAKVFTGYLGVMSAGFTARPGKLVIGPAGLKFVWDKGTQGIAEGRTDGLSGSKPVSFLLHPDPLPTVLECSHFAAAKTDGYFIREIKLNNMSALLEVIGTGGAVLRFRAASLADATAALAAVREACVPR